MNLSPKAAPTNPSPIQGIDHPVIAVRDMEGSRRVYERMGFTVPPRGSHLEWGTGNWCIMFQNDYLELRGIVDGSRYTHNLDQFLSNREGLMGTAFSSDAKAEDIVTFLNEQGLHPNPPRELTRNFELPSGNVKPRFRLVFFNQAETDGLMASLVCQHLTPELIRQPDFLRHANGATQILGMTSVVGNLTRTEEVVCKYFGAERVTRRNGTVEASAGRGGKLAFVDEATAERQGVALKGVPAPYLSEVILKTQSLAQANDAMRQGGIPFDATTGHIRVSPDQACGTWLTFVEKHHG